MKILENFKKELDLLKSKIYFVIECPFCHEKILAERDEFEYIPYVPKEAEETITRFDPYKEEKLKVIKSSDPSKDQFKIKMCPRCGHRNIIFSRDEFYKLEKLNWNCEKIN